MKGLGAARIFKWVGLSLIVLVLRGRVVSAAEWVEGNPVAEVSPAGTERPSFEKGLTFGVKFWAPSDAYEADQTGYRDAADILVYPIGYDSSQATWKVRGGLEVRGGLMFRRPKTGWTFGPSLGFISGPTQTTDIQGRSAFSGNGMATVKDDTSFLRFLFEVSKSIRLSSVVGFHLGGGVGLAQGKRTEKISNSGTFVSILGMPSSESFSRSWTGVTWELTPSLSIRRVEFGLSFAGFPKMKENDDFYEFKWNPTALFVGYRF